MKTCDICHAELVPVFPKQARRQDDDQLSSCLHIILVGGYGEYVDNLIQTPHARLCKTCADALLEREPWMRGLE